MRVRGGGALHGLAAFERRAQRNNPASCSRPLGRSTPGASVNPQFGRTTPPAHTPSVVMLSLALSSPSLSVRAARGRVVVVVEVGLFSLRRRSKSPARGVSILQCDASCVAEPEATHRRRSCWPPRLSIACRWGGFACVRGGVNARVQLEGALGRGGQKATGRECRAGLTALGIFVSRRRVGESTRKRVKPAHAACAHTKDSKSTKAKAKAKIAGVCIVLLLHFFCRLLLFVDCISFRPSSLMQFVPFSFVCLTFVDSPHSRSAAASCARRSVGFDSFVLSTLAHPMQSSLSRSLGRQSLFDPRCFFLFSCSCLFCFGCFASFVSRWLGGWCVAIGKFGVIAAASFFLTLSYRFLIQQKRNDKLYTCQYEGETHGGNSNSQQPSTLMLRLTPPTIKGSEDPARPWGCGCCLNE